MAQDATSLAAMDNMLSFMSQHGDVWQGATYWGAGPWWGDYMYSIEPANGVDKPQMGVLDAYAPSLGAAASVSTPQVTAALATDTGTSASDAVTSQVRISGHADANAVLHFALDGAMLTTSATTDASGGWSQDFTSLIGDGRHTLTVTETNTAGTGSAQVTFTKDTTAPRPTLGAVSARVSSASLTLAGTGEAGSTIAVLDGSASLGAPVSVAADGTWSTSVTLASLGTHSLSVRDTDLAGNAGTSASVTTTYDHAPAFPAGSATIINVASSVSQIATITASDSDPGDKVTYSLLDAQNRQIASTGGLSINPTSGVLSFTGQPAPGAKRAVVMASDRYGASAVETVTVNVSAPGRVAGTAGTGNVGQIFVSDPRQPTTLMDRFQAADLAIGSTKVPHSVLMLSHTLFTGAAANTIPSAALLTSHSQQVGSDTLIRTDTRQVIELLNVNRQTLLAHPADIAFV